MNSDTSIQRQSRNTGIPNIPAMMCHISVAILAVSAGFSIRPVAEWSPVSRTINDVGFAVRFLWKHNDFAGAITLILLCFHRDKN